MQVNSVGIAGELRCVITDINNEVKIDTGYQKNLILNQGLNFFGGGHGVAVNTSCAIGSGNSNPIITQTSLDSFVTVVVGTDTTSDYSYVDSGDGLYRFWEQKKYQFTGLSNVNISEVGLVSSGTTSADYYLTTRALIKDNFGTPTSISIKTGETLDIYYKIHKVIDTRDKTFVINVLDGSGGSVPYNAIIRPIDVGTPEHSVSDYIKTPSYGTRFSVGDLSPITSKPTESGSGAAIVFSPYIKDSFKRTGTNYFSLSEANANIRVIAVYLPFLPLQMRLGRVSDDSPIIKTASDALTIPLEFSWARYEGVL